MFPTLPRHDAGLGNGGNGASPTRGLAGLVVSDLAPNRPWPLGSLLLGLYGNSRPAGRGSPEHRDFHRVLRGASAQNPHPLEWITAPLSSDSMGLGQKRTLVLE